MRYLLCRNFCWQTLTLDRRVLESRTGQLTENPQANVSNSTLKPPAVDWPSESTVRQMAPKKWFCMCCQKRFAKGSMQNSTMWCHVCDWVHFTCSGLENETDYNDNLLWSKCSRSRVMIDDDDPFEVEYTKIHEAYTNREKTTAFRSSINLARATNCSLKHDNRYLNSIKTYTMFKLTRKRFPRLKVMSYWLHEVWSIDLAEMQHLSGENLGVRYLFVAVDTLSRFLWIVGVKSKTSKACSEPLKKIISTNKQRIAPKICATKKLPEKIWADQGREFAGEFEKFCKENRIEIYSTRSETKTAVAERSIRTLKTMIFNCLQVRDTNRYFDLKFDLKNMSQSLTIGPIVWLNWLQPKCVKKTFLT